MANVHVVINQNKKQRTNIRAQWANVHVAINQKEKAEKTQAN